MRSSSPTSTSPLSLIPSSSSSFATANPNRNRLKLPYRSFSLVVVSSFPRRHHRPNRHRLRRSPFPPPVSPSSSDDNPNRISLSLSLDSLSDRLSSGLQRFIAAGADAFNDLSTSVQIEPGRHLTFSCRRSSLLFLANLLALGFIVFVAARVSTGLGFWRGLGFGERREVVRRRDRSLAGKEVVVGTASPRRREECIPVRGNPVPSNVGKRGKGMVKKGELPEWWPLSVSSSSSSSSEVAFENKELKREADRLVRGQAFYPSITFGSNVTVRKY